MIEKAVVQAELAAKGSIRARLEGVLHSFEQNQLAFGAGFLVLFFGSLAMKAIVGTAWTDVGAGLSLAGLAAQLICWLMHGRQTHDRQRGASVSVAQGGQVIQANDIDPREAAIALRELIQERKPLPAPDGEVVSDATGKQVTRPYTPEEQERFMTTLAAGMRAHDVELLERIQQMIDRAALSAPSTPAVDAPATARTIK